MEVFIPNSIKDIILYYLNPHELYLEELKDKTKYITQISEDDFIVDYSCTEYIIANTGGYWEVGPPEYSDKKIDIMTELNARMYDLNKIYIKHQERTNRCYMHY